MCLLRSHRPPVAQRWDAKCREAVLRPYSANCAFGRLWPRTGRADQARERGAYIPKVDLKLWPVAAAGRRPAILSPSRVRCAKRDDLGSWEASTETPRVCSVRRELLYEHE